MFTKEELDFISNLIGYKFDPDTASDDTWVDVEDKVGDKLIVEGLDKDYNPNDIGLLCESILSKLP